MHTDLLPRPRKPLRLLSIPVSHFCEKVRWVLDLHDIPYTERGLLPFFHVLPVRLAGGQRATPVLITPQGTFYESSHILQHLDRYLAPNDKLYPNDPGLRTEAESLEKEFDQRLGPHTRRWAYHHLLPHKKILLNGMFGNAPVSWLQRLGFRSGYPVFAALMRKVMNINEASAQRSIAAIQECFNLVEQKLADGRRYLVDDRFTVADIAFAALAAPVVRAPEYGARMAPLKEYPKPLQEQIHTFRQTTAGQYVLRLFHDHRPPSPWNPQHKA